MKKVLFIVTMLMSIGITKAQNVVDDFNVGPYEVYYKGKGDVNYRLKKGVDLYEYFGLKKDTVINAVETKGEPLKKGIQLSLFSETAMNRCARYSMVYGIEGVWKQRIASKTYFNGGLSLGYAGATTTDIKQNMLEIGLPLSVEICNLNSKKATLYGGIGVTPAFYSTASVSYVNIADGASPEKSNGIYVAPHLDLGCYVPVGSQIVKVGVSWRYKINCSGSDYDVYYMVMGRTFIGANIGIIF